MVSRSVFVLATCVLATPALAQTASCAGGEAPGAFSSSSCGGICGKNSNIWGCSLAGCNSGSGAWVVTDYNGNGKDFSAWGSCGATTFCCTFEDTAGGTVDTVRLIGSDHADDLSLAYSTEDLEPHRAYALLGFAHGGDGNDWIGGSNFTGSSYRDNLYGNDNDDDIHGMDGADWIDGGPGADLLAGGDGDDAVVGGSGTDQLWGDDYLGGGSGDDTLCDKSFDNAACQGAQLFYGDAGDDTLWLTYDAGCDPGSDFDAASDAGAAGSDVCGHTSWSTLASCESWSLTTEPAGCVDPN